METILHISVGQGLKNCKNLKDFGNTSSGIYHISLGRGDLTVYCDQETDGGGWLVSELIV